MTPTHFASDVVLEKEMNSRAAARVAWTLAHDSHLADDPDEAFRLRGFARYVPQTKAGVNPMLHADPNVALHPLNSAFLGMVDRESILGKIPGLVKFPLAGAGRLQVGTVTASAVDEGDVKPVATMTFDVPPAPTKIEASIVVSAEALRSYGAATQAGITQVLVSATAAATDVELVALLTGSGTVVASATPGALLAEISDGGARWPVLLGGIGSLLALPAGTIRDLQAIGVTVLASPAAAGMLIALDGAGLLVGDDTVEIQTARHATLRLTDSSASPDDGILVNLWERNMAALRAERWIRLAVRAGAAAYASTGSPGI